MIEAVFESPDLKKQVFAEIMPHLAPDAVLGSNTSTLPITGLASGVDRPEDFIGLHFFSPVDKMPLLEIIGGEKTSDATLAKAVDIALQIKKTPIVVNDSRGFFTSRVIGTFINEAVAMLGEGAAPSSIEQAGLAGRLPGPAAAADGRADPHAAAAHPPGDPQGRRGGGRHLGGAPLRGDHRPDGRARPQGPLVGRRASTSTTSPASARGLWPGLSDEFGAATGDLPFEDMQERMLFAEALETVKCFDEGVLHTIADANIGSIMGIGFPAWTGGVAQYIDGYPGGLPGFVERARILAKAYGDRFAPAGLAGREGGEGRSRCAGSDARLVVWFSREGHLRTHRASEGALRSFRGRRSRTDEGLPSPLYPTEGALRAQRPARRPIPSALTVS